MLTTLQTYSQRYVSPDLTHFVGRRKRSLREQYAVLRKILKEGELRGPRKLGERRFQRIIPSLKLSQNIPYLGPYVCFCDIPISDLGLHMAKYSRFGLAFKKEFLLGKGATPVMYVPRDGRPAGLPFLSPPRRPVSTNADSFDKFFVKFKRISDELGKTGPEPNQDLYNVVYFLHHFLLNHLKFFDALAPDEHKHNYYMEREWRVGTEVNFELENVERVIIPRKFARQFRRDFPDYYGEVFFAQLA